MKKASIYFVALLLTSLSINGFSKPVSYKVVTKCFFIYAPIAETGRALNIQALFSYGQKE